MIDAPPAAVLLHQARRAQLLDDGGEKAGRRGQVIEIIAARAVFLIDFSQQLGQFLVDLAGRRNRRRCSKCGARTSATDRDRLLVVANSPISLPIMSRNCSVISSLRAKPTRRIPWRAVVLGEVVKRRDQLALGEIAGSAEDHHDAGIAGAAGAGSVIRYRMRSLLRSAFSCLSITLGEFSYGAGKCTAARRSSAAGGALHVSAELVAHARTAFFRRKCDPGASGSA